MSVTRPFHLMLKPAGAACNLRCTYCYYLKTAALYPAGGRMTDAVLERVTAAYLHAHPGPEVVFGWQGGEPLLMGIAFYQRALAYQRQYARPHQRVVNAIQTNGTLLTDAWAALFAEHRFLVGISLDGPPALHDAYRQDPTHGGSYERVVAGLQTLLRHQVDVNALVTVHRANVAEPLQVYRHLLELGLAHLQFIPIVERSTPTKRRVTPWTVRQEAFGAFLCAIFDQWARADVGRVFVQLFESALSVWAGYPASLCTFAPHCGRALVVEQTGDLYACDHFVTPEHCRGTITERNLADLVQSAPQQHFGEVKTRLSRDCRDCPVRQLCQGDCPKHRVRQGSDGIPISYLCPAYRRFFTHSAPVLQAMAHELRAGRPATNVMDVLQCGTDNSLMP